MQVGTWLPPRSCDYECVRGARLSQFIMSSTTSFLLRPRESPRYSRLYPQEFAGKRLNGFRCRTGADAPCVCCEIIHGIQVLSFVTSNLSYNRRSLRLSYVMIHLQRPFDWWKCSKLSHQISCQTELTSFSTWLFSFTPLSIYFRLELLSLGSLCDSVFLS